MLDHEFMQLYNELCVAYGKEFKRDQAVVYYKYLGQSDYQKLKIAIEQIIQSSNLFLPTIGQLIQKMKPPDIGQAWDRVIDVAREGCRNWRRLTDTDIATVSAIGGMHNIQNADEERLHFIFNNFQKQYSILLNREVKYETAMQRLKELNMVPETFKFIAKVEGLLRLSKPAPMLDQIGVRI